MDCLTIICVLSHDSSQEQTNNNVSYATEAIAHIHGQHLTIAWLQMELKHKNEMMIRQLQQIKDATKTKGLMTTGGQRALDSILNAPSRGKGLE